MAKIQLIDDDLSFCKLVKYHLEQEGHEVSVAADGQTGVLSAVNLMPDLVILDLKMPRMPGVGVINHLRGDDGKMIFPVLVVTAAAENEYIQDQFMLDGFLVKPFEMEDLSREVNKIIARTTKSEKQVEDKENAPEQNDFIDQSHIKAAEAENEFDDSYQKSQVCIVEDSTEVLEKLTKKYEDEGFAVKNIPAGREAIEILGHGLPPLLLVKFKLPDIQGDEVIGELKEVIKSGKSKIILYTSVSEKDTKRLKIFSTIIENIYGNETLVNVIESNDSTTLFEESQRMMEE